MVCYGGVPMVPGVCVPGPRGAPGQWGGVPGPRGNVIPDPRGASNFKWSLRGVPAQGSNGCYLPGNQVVTKPQCITSPWTETGVKT